MLAFERLSIRGTDRAELVPKTLIVAGWTGRDEKALHHHIEELAAIGVPRPSSVPAFYRISTANLTQTATLQSPVRRHTCPVMKVERPAVHEFSA